VAHTLVEGVISSRNNPIWHSKPNKSRSFRRRPGALNSETSLQGRTRSARPRSNLRRSSSSERSERAPRFLRRLGSPGRPKGVRGLARRTTQHLPRSELVIAWLLASRVVGCCGQPETLFARATVAPGYRGLRLRSGALVPLACFASAATEQRSCLLSVLLLGAPERRCEQRFGCCPHGPVWVATPAPREGPRSNLRRSIISA
jgi:hypothetical protein